MARLAWCFALLVAAGPAGAVDAGTVDAGPVAAGPVDAGAPSAAVDALRARAAQIDALAAGTLDPAVSPSSLFDVPLDDEAAVALEVERLHALASVAPPDAAPDAGPGAPDPALRRARAALDAARLRFLSLPRDRREALLHPKKAPAVDDGRSEAARLAAGELSRLLTVERAQADFAASLAARAGAGARRDAALGWQRKAREALAQGSAADVDALFDDVVRALAGAHEELAAVFDEIAAGKSAVPAPGPDPLKGAGDGPEVAEARAARSRVEHEAARLAGEETELRERDARSLVDEIDALNRVRLELLPALSSQKRAAVTHLTGEGLRQASLELTHLVLVLRGQKHATARFLAGLKNAQAPAGTDGLGAAARLAVLALLWGVAIALFVGWRRRAPALLDDALRRTRTLKRARVLAQRSPIERALLFFGAIRRPLEWLALFFVLRWLLPRGAGKLLEVQLLTVVLGWVLAGMVAVSIVNALAQTGDKRDRDAALRLRSLRLVGRVVTVFGLILSISARVVGRGTIYEWVFSTCWFAAIPVFLLLVRWWRPAVFARVDGDHHASAFERWVLENKVGWKSFLAATAGALFLFSRGAWRALRLRAGGFDVTRRALAWLFRRELSKLEPEQASARNALQPLDDAAARALGPDTPSTVHVATALDDELLPVMAALRERRGRVVALIGERGSGKTTALARLAAGVEGCLSLRASSPDLDALCTSACAALGVPEHTALADVAARIDEVDGPPGVLVDDCQRFVRPVMGGLASFDALLAAAREHSRNTVWLLAFDDAVAPFLERSRGLHPLFDDVVRVPPWREDEVAELLRARARQAGVEPSYDRLLDSGRPADAEVLAEAIAERAAGYSRLIWDYADGNPGIALDVWRRALGRDHAGVHVRFFPSLDEGDLERLPDPSLFVLRAVSTMAPVDVRAIEEATRLRPPVVADALRYALARGYLVDDGGFRITWTWLRPITRLLARRHLTVTS